MAAELAHLIGFEPLASVFGELGIGISWLSLRVTGIHKSLVLMGFLLQAFLGIPCNSSRGSLAIVWFSAFRRDENNVVLAPSPQ